MSDYEACPVCGEDYNIQRPHSCPTVTNLDAEIAALQARVAELEAAIREHKESFAPDDAATEDNQLWDVLAGERR